MAIRDSVAATMQQFRAYAERARWDSLGALYSDRGDFRFYENGTLRYGSARDVRAALAALPPGMRIRTDYRDTEITPLAPGLAVASALFSSTFADEAGTQFGFEGAVSLLWVHEPEGWRILVGHSSAPVPRGG